MIHISEDMLTFLQHPVLNIAINRRIDLLIRTEVEILR